MKRPEEEPAREIGFIHSEDLNLEAYRQAALINGEIVLSTRTLVGRQNVALDIICPEDFSIFRDSIDKGRSGEIPPDQKDRHSGDYNTRYVILAPGESAIIDNRYMAFYKGAILRDGLRRFLLKSTEELRCDEIPWAQDFKTYIHYINPNLI